ncbi:MAG TPA: SPOR domain-containing protein [Saprospiraceae bacterium]|nr:SPOR domain-containing protein [Saprospiraceae bacterium]HNM26051.1 SPOR domain-containing protein [Saprospiraceae bacterium]
MKSNSLFTYVIYALLLGLILIAGYKACQIRQEQALQKKEREELEQVMRDLGYTNDTTANGSSYLGNADSNGTAPKSAPTTAPGAKTTTSTPKVSATGIEDDEPAATTAKSPATTTKPAANTARPLAATPSSTTSGAKTSGGSTQPSGLSGNVPSYGGRYLVITGAFKQMENARDEMETLVKAGYRNAEVKKFTGAWAHVIALRTNDKAAAERAVQKLKSEGYPGAYLKDSK